MTRPGEGTEQDTLVHNEAVPERERHEGERSCVVQGPATLQYRLSSKRTVGWNSIAASGQATPLQNPERLRQSHFSISQRGRRRRLIRRSSNGNCPKDQMWEAQADDSGRTHLKWCFKFWSRNLTGCLSYAGTVLGRRGTKMEKTQFPGSETGTGRILIKW